LTSILRYMAVLDDWSLAGHTLRMRFVPDYFNLDFVDPVLCVEMETGEERGGLEHHMKLIGQGLVDDLEIDDTGIAVSIDNLDLPVCFTGSATWSFSAYELRDCLNAIESYRRSWSQHEAEIYRLRQIVNRASSFIDQTVARIERKQKLSHQKHEEYGRQIELLFRVRRKLQSDE